MNGNRPEIAWVFQELPAYPNQVRLGLQVEGNAGLHAGMCEKVATGAKTGLQAPVELQVIVRKQGPEGCTGLSQRGFLPERRAPDKVQFNTVRQKRRIASVMKPSQSGLGLIQEG